MIQRCLTYVAMFPTILVASLGIIGIIASVIIIDIIRRRKYRCFQDTNAVVLILGSLFYNYAVTNPEIRRHFAMIASVVVILFIAKNLPSAKTLSKSYFWRTFLIACCFTGILLEAYYVYSYTGKANRTDLSVNWQDYFRMNDVIKKKYANIPVQGASRGLSYFPLVMEVTNSYMGDLEAFVHSKITKAQVDEIKKITLPFDTDKIGIEAIVWGPVEERQWGPKARKRLLKGENLLEICGSVALYRLSNQLKRAKDKSLEHEKFINTLLNEQVVQAYLREKGFGVNIYQGKYYALAIEEGDFIPKKFKAGKYKQCIVGESIDDLKRKVDLGIL